MRVERSEPKILRATLCVEAPCHGERFDQGRFAGAVFAHDEGDLRMEIDLSQILDGGERIGVGRAVCNAIPQHLGTQQIMPRLESLHEMRVPLPLISHKDFCADQFPRRRSRRAAPAAATS